MFGFRSDGKKVKFDDPLMRVMPHIMTARHDSQNHYTFLMDCEPLDNFIEQQREKGVSFSYTHIIYALFIRLHKERPGLNRFIVNRRVYQRNSIGVSMAMRKILKDEYPETTIKNEFTGNESIFDVKEMLDNEIKKNSGMQSSNSTDKLMKLFNKTPNAILTVMVGFLKLLDRWGIMPKSIIKLSPFHSTMWITNLKSIKMDSIFHHLYDFGTSSLFICLSQPKMMPVYDDETNTFKPRKTLEICVVNDERISNGLYWSNSIKVMRKYMANPSLLLERLPEEEVKKNEAKSKK